jgi:hypothetical protein
MPALVAWMASRSTPWDAEVWKQRARASVKRDERGETPSARHKKMAKCRKPQETRNSPETGSNSGSRGGLGLTMEKLGSQAREPDRAVPRWYCDLVD